MLALSCTLAWSMVHCAVADPYTNPRRVIGGKTVDLTPLFQWDQGQRAGRPERPLKAWIRVQGTVVKAVGGGWEVDALYQGPDGRRQRGKIFLKNPPVQEQAEFERARAELEQMKQDFAQARAEGDPAAQASGFAAAPGSDMNDPRFGGRRGRDQGTRSGEAAKQREFSRRITDLVQSNVVDAGGEMADVAAARLRYQQLQQKVARSSGPDGNFRVDCVALRNGQTFNSMPVFDRGFVVKQ